MLKQPHLYAAAPQPKEKGKKKTRESKESGMDGVF